VICGLIYDHEDESRTRGDKQRRKYRKMDERAKDKLVRSPRENGREWKRIGFPERSSLKNWKGREEGEDPENMERGSRKSFSSAGSEKMERVGGR